jgi:hypothetical protein
MTENCECKLKCPFAAEFFKWIDCQHLDRNDQECMGRSIGHGGSWCTTMIGKAMLDHKTWIGNDY